MHSRLATVESSSVFIGDDHAPGFPLRDARVRVKGSDAQGRRTSTTQIVVSVRGCRQGYSPTPSFNVDWGMPPQAAGLRREREEIRWE